MLWWLSATWVEGSLRKQVQCSISLHVVVACSYVGGAPGKIDLYVGKDVIKRAIPMEGACDELIDLIKTHGRWVEPEPKEEEALVAA
jgi:hypothetical protein